MKNLKSILTIGWFFYLSLGAHATSPQKKDLLLASCVRPVATYEMQVNNVRARLYSGGLLFNKDQSNGNYFTPASASLPVSAIFSGGVWVGGVDRSGSIKLSASTYQTDGSDYFAGPLDVLGTTEATNCSQWDKIFTAKGNNILHHIQNYKEAVENQTVLRCNDISDDILYWPAQGNPFFEEKYGWKLPDQPLANYFDQNNDGHYNPCLGDYPIIDNVSCTNGIYKIPTEINFFIFNDAGGPQTLSGLNNLQMEFQVNAFAYNTTNELNDMTFYQYKMINKSPDELIDCYFSWWLDPDLGCYTDDYVGSDPELGMAYIYNEDAIDGEDSGCGGINNYGDEIPILGIDFVQGPKVIKVFKRDANGNFIYDADGKKILIDPEPLSGRADTLVIGQMSSFIYNNLREGSPFMHDPRRGKEDDFYSYMKGFWLDKTPITFGGNGYNPGSVDSTKFAFPDDPNDPNGWSMCTANIPKDDKKMLMSVGPMLMSPGSTNTLTLSVFSVLDVPYPCPDLTKLRYADRIAQDLFDNCLVNEYFTGPDAPDITFEQKKAALTLKLENGIKSNNFNEGFSYTIPNLGPNVESEFRFEGYQVYQLANTKVRVDQLNDPQYARLVGQTDIKNNVQDIYNWNLTLNPDTSASAEKYIWQKVIKVKGKNDGLQHTFDITEDLFATGEKALVNNKNYHFCALAYAHNNWKDFDSIEKVGQKTPYIEGINNFKVYTIAPKFTLDENVPQLKVTRISGEGNPHVFLKMEDDMYDKILSTNFDGKVNYKTGYGPLQAVVTDVTKINKNKYRLEITGTMDIMCKYDENAVWKLTDITNNNVLLEDKPLWYIKEYMLSELGFSITVQNYENPGVNIYENNGGVDVRLEYKDKTGPFWFNAIKDGGQYEGERHLSFDFVQNNNFWDKDGKLSIMGDGFFVPLTSIGNIKKTDVPYLLSPLSRDWSLINGNITSLNFRDLNNVDLVFTSDKSKWSKCIVVETGFDDQTITGLETIDNTRNFELRSSQSKDENGVEIPNSTGFSYFPGYAVDVETGKRLNIFFGENSIFSGENAMHMQGQNPIGGDMIFNPSSEWIIAKLLNSNLPADQVLALIGGAQHYIYVSRMEYDGCAAFGERLKRNPTTGAGPSIINKLKVVSGITWTSFPVLSPAFGLTSLSNGLIPNDLTVRMRVDNTYSSSRLFNLDNDKACLTTGDNPVYEFGFEKLDPNAQNNITLDNIFINPNPVRLSNNATVFRLLNLPDDSEIKIMDMQGQVRWKADASSGDKQTYLGPGSTSTEFTLDGSRFLPGLYLISIKDKKSGKMSTLKWVGL